MKNVADNQGFNKPTRRRSQREIDDEEAEEFMGCSIAFREGRPLPTGEPALTGKVQSQLRKLEALEKKTTNEEERKAARREAQHLRGQLDEIEGWEPDKEMRCILPEEWMRKLFTAICRRYGLETYRKPRQRESTVLVRAPVPFQHKTLIPEYRAREEDLRKRLDEVADQAVREVMYIDVGETDEPRRVPPDPNRR